MPSKTLQRLHQMDYYIRNANTGAPNELALKIRTSERQIYRYVELLKKLGASIEFCNKRKTYYYSKDGGFNFKFEEVILPSTQTQPANGLESTSILCEEQTKTVFTYTGLCLL